MASDSIIQAQVDIRIPFHDVDAAEVVWHGHYLKYIELARCKLLDKIDYNYPQMKASGYFWPVIDIRLRYPGAARFQNLVRVVASLAEWEHRLKIKYQIYDKTSGKRLTHGYSVQVAVDAISGEMQLASPPILMEKLGLDL